ncbi:MAG: hypothetical protein KA746_16525 [Pyrinomonadaceae bacterium]|nr:hypothetical protein [Pyrinomonadaceae bacterium]MBP6211876.1 hypothetical protein [Pyrinomonadaceae bacterium]
MSNDRTNPTVDKFIAELAGNEKNVRFARLLKICEDAFGECRISGGHHIFKTPWPGDPRINLQNAGNKAKPYQVKQVFGALKKLRSINN